MGDRAKSRRSDLYSICGLGVVSFAPRRMGGTTGADRVSQPPVGIASRTGGSSRCRRRRTVRPPDWRAHPYRGPSSCCICTGRSPALRAGGDPRCALRTTGAGRSGSSAGPGRDGGSGKPSHHGSRAHARDRLAMAGALGFLPSDHRLWGRSGRGPRLAGRAHRLAPHSEDTGGSAARRASRGRDGPPSRVRA